MFKIKKYKKIQKKIYEILPKYEAMSDIDLKDQTRILKEEIAQGKKINELLPRAFSVIIEANNRVLGLKAYKVQVLGGISLFFGNVAEIKTGEGKTLVATLPLYVRALEGKKGNFLITANEYLAERDGNEMGKVFQWLNLSVGIGIDDIENDIEEKRRLYNSDIIYTTHSKLGFDYLFDNLGISLSDQVVTKFNFAIIDEIDAILLDNAQTALVISGGPKVQSNYYKICDWFIKSLEDDDYKLSGDKRHVWLTYKGVEKIRKYFNISDIYSKKYIELYRHIILALQANKLKKNGVDYVVIDGKVLLLDPINGRLMTGVKLQGGIHQAIECKEDVEVSKETKTLGTISYQSLFKSFIRLSGMTGTAMTDKKEFMETYHLPVIEIPTHVPIQRKDRADKIYVANESKIRSSIDEVKKGVNEKRPILIETGSVSMSDLYSLILLENKIPHNLLNARTVAREKKIIMDAGRSGAVTLATSMAGRGTDIKLTSESKKNGGLKVIGTERMNNKRIDNQFRGRAGRQGEPGESIFFVSLEDKVIVENSAHWVRNRRKRLLSKISKGELDPNKPLKQIRLKNIMNKAQKKIVNTEIQSRKNTLAFDTIINTQRNQVYKSRNKVMEENTNYLKYIIERALKHTINIFISHNPEMSIQKISDFVFNNINSDYSFNDIKYQIKRRSSKEDIFNFLLEISSKFVDMNYSRLSNSKQLLYFQKIIILRAIDRSWVDQLDYLQQLKSLIDGRMFAQHKPLNEFEREARIHFLDMESEIYKEIFKSLTLSDLKCKEDGTIEVEFP